MGMTNTQAVQTMNDVKERVSELLNMAMMLNRQIEEQHSAAMAAASVLRNDEMLPALAGLVDAMERTQAVVESLAGARGVIDRTN